MRIRVVLLPVIIVLGLGGCTKQESDSAARDVGRTAHKVAVETEHAAKKVEKELEKAVKDAREGWKEGQREDRANPRK